MTDRNPTIEEIIDAGEYICTCDGGSDDGQYYHFLGKSLFEIPLLSLWDLCYLFARGMVDARSVPEKSIPDLDLKLLNEARESNSEDFPVFLRRIQRWLSNEIVKSIDKKEIELKIIGRFIDGDIDTKRTFIDINELYGWFASRNIYVSGLQEKLFSDYSRLLDRIRIDIFSVSRILESKIYDPDYEIPDIADMSPGYIVVKSEENNAPITDKVHGNAERFARNREEVLGVALSVVTQWPDQCKNDSGKFEATKIAKLIDEKSPIYWRKTGEPPLDREKMERELSKWINKTGK
jgi:hypothetical protein